MGSVIHYSPESIRAEAAKLLLPDEQKLYGYSEMHDILNGNTGKTYNELFNTNTETKTLALYLERLIESTVDFLEQTAKNAEGWDQALADGVGKRT